MDLLLLLALLCYLAGAFYSVIIFSARSEGPDRY
jgi:hypothetical protein